MIEISVIEVGGSIGAIAVGVLLYWKLLDRRLTDIKNHQTWLKDEYEGNTVGGQFIEGKITKMTCYRPKSFPKRMLRYILLDYGSIEIHLLLQPGVPNYFWDELKDLIEKEGVEVVNYIENPQYGGSSIILRKNSLHADVTEMISIPVKIVDTFLQTKGEWG